MGIPRNASRPLPGTEARMRRVKRRGEGKGRFGGEEKNPSMHLYIWHIYIHSSSPSCCIAAHRYSPPLTVEHAGTGHR